MQTGERRAVAALWSLQGIGPRTIEAVERHAGPLGELLARPLAAWAASVPWTDQARAALLGVDCLARVADGLERRLAGLGYGVVFPGDAAFPPLLLGLPTIPPLLFVRGPGAAAAPRRRVAMVGTRRVEPAAWDGAVDFARRVALEGLGVVSGGAEGIDTACHTGALAAGGETWLFMPSAIDQADPPQRALFEPFEEGGGTVFSEFPPGTRSNKSTFVRRNRLISGASDATIIVRAPLGSGALHTARYALEQRRPLLAMPGDYFRATGAGGNELLRKGHAKPCVAADEVLQAVGLKGAVSGAAGPEKAPRAGDPGALSSEARSVLAVLDRTPADFDTVAVLAGLESGLVASALLELELGGHAVQKPGRLFEKTG